MTETQSRFLAGLPTWLLAIPLTGATVIAIIFAAQGQLTLELVKDLVLALSPLLAPYLARVAKKRLPAKSGGKTEDKSP